MKCSIACKRLDFLAVHQREGVAHILGAAGAADAMDIIFRMFRHIVVDDVTDAGDIESARGDIGRDHHFVFAALETFERFDAFALGAIGMQNGDGMFPLFSLCAILSAPCLVREKISALSKLVRSSSAMSKIELLLGRDRINRVRDCFGRRAAHADFDQLGIAQNPGGQPFDLRRQRRGEKQRLPVGRNLFNDAPDIGQEIPCRACDRLHRAREC